MADNEKIAKKGDTVKVHYEGSFSENNKVFDSSYLKDPQGNQRPPIEFKLGEGKVVKGFDEAVEGMKLGEKKTVEIKPENAYGDRDNKRVTQIPVEELKKNNIEAKPGLMLMMQDKDNPQLQMRGVITEVKDNTATLDFNHPLAGHTIKFMLELVDVKEN